MSDAEEFFTGLQKRMDIPDSSHSLKRKLSQEIQVSPRKRTSFHSPEKDPSGNNAPTESNNRPSDDTCDANLSRPPLYPPPFTVADDTISDFEVSIQSPIENIDTRAYHGPIAQTPPKQQHIPPQQAINTSPLSVSVDAIDFTPHPTSSQKQPVPDPALPPANQPQRTNFTSKSPNFASVTVRDVSSTSKAADSGKDDKDSSVITTPGTSPAPPSSLTGKSKASLGPLNRKRVPSKLKQPIGKAKAPTNHQQDNKTTPVEYAKKLLEKQAASTKPKTRQYLQGKVIFYAGGDWKYAGERTRKRMEYIIRHGGTLLPTYDAALVTHVVTDTHMTITLKALGLRKLSDIPEHVPTVKWSWVISGAGRSERKMDYDFLHAAFQSRIYAGEGWGGRNSGKGKAKEKEVDETRAEGEEEEGGSGEFSRISQFTQDVSLAAVERSPSDAVDLAPSVEVPLLVQDPEQYQSFISPPTSPVREAQQPEGTSRELELEDPLAKFYAQARAEHEAAWSRNEVGLDSLSDTGGRESDDNENDRDEPPEQKGPVHKRGFTCDNKESHLSTCANQDVVDKLKELMELHQAKPSDEDHWRVLGYGKCIRALRNYPVRIKSFSQARSIRGVGEKTATKIMEIIKTGGLRRIGYEKTEDVEATGIFQGIYGVGRHTAFMWYASGCRTLDDVRARKGGIKLSHVQELGVQFYDDINDRMPRAEAEAIFELIKSKALQLDPNLYIEIMGSFRRGKSTCGDIDILITRTTDDGKTHAGILPALLAVLHSEGILTEDLHLSDDLHGLEATYRGLCRLPESVSLPLPLPGGGGGGGPRRRRRIDFLAVPWSMRGAALLYFTGDAIFNRAMRLKANVLGYSLNQRGLFGGVVRNARDRRVKVCEGKLVASEREEDIFRILGVPWQEPHERVRGA